MFFKKTADIFNESDTFDLFKAKKIKEGKDISIFCSGIMVEETLKAGEKIQLVGLGTVELKKVDAKTGINPRTKEAVKIPACKKPVLKFGDAYKAKFN